MYPYLNFIEKSERKIAIEKVKLSILKNNITIIQGLRRIGKSLVMNTVSKDEAFINYEKKELDAKEFGVDLNLKAKEFISTFKKNSHKKYLLLVDEFQDLTDWNKFFWTLHKMENVKVIATGSVIANTKGMQETEGGRYVYILMNPLSFEEYIEIHRENLLGNNLTEKFNKYATMGSYPDQEFNENLKNYKKQVTYNIIERIKSSDHLSIYSIKDHKQVSSILLHIIENIGQSLSTNSISEKLLINARTVSKIINYLIAVFIIYEINNDVPGKGKATTFNRKFYLVDHTFYLYIYQSEFKSLNKINTTYEDFLFENIIINQVKNIYEREIIDIRFLKNKKHDIDLVITKNDQKKFFEIKNSESSNSLTKDQKQFATQNKLNVIYKGKTQIHKDIQFINYLEFIMEAIKWI